MESEGPSEGGRVMLLIPPASDTGVLCRDPKGFLASQALRSQRQQSEPVTNYLLFSAGDLYGHRKRQQWHGRPTLEKSCREEQIRRGFEQYH